MSRLLKLAFAVILFCGAAAAQVGPAPSCAFVGVNAQVGTSYTIAANDKGKLVTLNNTGAVAVTLPVATGFTKTFCFFVENQGAGAVTITPTTSTIDGGSTLVLNQNQGVTVYTDQTNYQIIRGAGGTVPTGSTNVLPTVVSVSTVNVIGAGTTFTITPPASIVNGNPLVAVLAVAGQNAETWTPAAGFAQIGSTVGNASGDKIALAVFCKVAASESGSYVFTFNNGASGIGAAVILQLGGTTCAPDTSVTANANAATLSVGSLTTTTANDLLISLGVHTNGNPTTKITNLISATQQVQNNGLAVFSMPQGAIGSTGAFNFVSYATSSGVAGSVNAFAGFALAFSPSTTSSTTPFTPNGTGGALSTSQINTVGVQASGTIQADSFAFANGGASPSISKSVAGALASGDYIPLLTMNASNAMVIDPGQLLTQYAFGGGIKGGARLILSSGDFEGVSADASQDLQVTSFDASNNLVIGCLSAACTGQTQENDVIVNAQTSKVIRLRNNFADVATVTGTNLSSTAYGTATNCSSSAAPAVCGSAAAGSFVIAASGTAVTVNTTAVTANSQIFIQEDETLGTRLSVTCNTGILANPPAITARTAATSFAVGITAGLAVNPVCFSYWIVN